MSEWKKLKENFEDAVDYLYDEFRWGLYGGLRKVGSYIRGIDEKRTFVKGNVAFISDVEGLHITGNRRITLDVPADGENAARRINFLTIQTQNYKPGDTLVIDDKGKSLVENAEHNLNACDIILWRPDYEKRFLPTYAPE